MIKSRDILGPNGDSSGQAIITYQDIYKHRVKTQEGDPSYDSLNEAVNVWEIPLGSDYEIKEKSESAVRIVRTFYTKKINASLEWLSMNHETAMSSTPYIQPLLENLKEYRDEHFTDAYSSFLSALYDALAGDDSWVKLRREDFAEIMKIVTSLNNRRKLDYDTIDKAINELEELGLDSTPF